METKQLISHLKGLTDLEFQEVESSNIYLVAYQSNQRMLYVIFRDKRKNAGDPEWIYSYRVNAACYRAFLEAKSKGQFFIENIKPYVKFKYQITY